MAEHDEPTSSASQQRSMSLKDAIALAQRHHSSGELRQAEQIYRQILAAVPDHPAALHLLGVVAFQQGRNAEALTHIRRSIELKGDFAEAHNNLGCVLKEQSRLDDAVAAFRRAVELKGDYSEAWNNLGIAFCEAGDFDAAESACRRAIELKPDWAHAHVNLGKALLGGGKTGEAIEAIRRGIELQDNLAEAHHAMGRAMVEQDAIEEAIDAFARAVELQPGDAKNRNDLGCALLKMGRYDQAIAASEQALAIDPNYAKAHNDIGVALNLRGNLGEAVAAFDRAIAIDAEFAEAHFNRSAVMLLEGDFQQGWAGYEWRSRCDFGGPDPIQPDAPLWDGRNLDGKRILLQWEQGFGDTLQFVRYAPLVAGRGGAVVLACQAPLARLLESTPGVEQVIPHGSPLPPVDLYCPLLSLPRIFGAVEDTIPAEVPYVWPKPGDAAAWRERLAPHDGLRVAIAWAGNPRRATDRARSIPFEAFLPLTAVEGASFFSVQVGPRSGDFLSSPAGPAQVVDLSPHLSDFADTAAAIGEMDLVITADTAVAHLAGAMGKDVWVLLPCVPDWRWLLGRDDSPWYPTARLFRQKTAGDWPGVIQRAGSALRDRIEMKGK